jgi:DNA polymerase-3 subunit alpha
MAVFVLEDLQGQVDVVLFPDTLSKFAALLVADSVVFVKGRVDNSRGKPNILAEEMISPGQIGDRAPGQVGIKLDAGEISQHKVSLIKDLCQKHHGDSAVCVAIATDKGKVFATVSRSLYVTPSLEFCKRMRQLVGKENFSLGDLACRR